MKLLMENWRGFLNEDEEEEEERTELDKIKEIFANASGQQAVELADMVGLGDDPQVKAMKEIVEIAVDMLDTVTSPDFLPNKSGETDMAREVWKPLMRKNLEIIYPEQIGGRLGAPGVWRQFIQLRNIYMGVTSKEAKAWLEQAADWAGHPVELPS